MAAPQIGSTISNQILRFNKDFSLIITENRFTDVDNDIVSVTATYSDGSALPSWWNFVAGYRDGGGVWHNASFTVPRTTGVVGVYSIRITATDSGGLTASQTKTFTLYENTVPVLVALLVDQIFYFGVGAPSSQPYQFGAGDFSDDPDNDFPTNAYSAFARVDDNDVDLPTGITFSPGARKFTGQANELEGSAGVHTIRVYATDGLATIFDEFTITVEQYNQQVITNYNPLPVTAYTNQEFTYPIPSDMFTDPDADGGSLVYSATLEDDSPLPSWIAMLSGTLVGTPDSGDEGTINIKITATDTGGKFSSAILTITVQAYAVPSVTGGIPDITVIPGRRKRYIIPRQGMFTSSGGEELSYAVITTLPSYIAFDTNKRRFIISPSNANTGEVTVVTVRVSDSLGYVDNSFTITIGPIPTKIVTNDNPIDNIYLQIDESLNYTFASDTFSITGGGTITYEAVAVTPIGIEVPLSYMHPWINFNPTTRTFTGDYDPEDFRSMKTKSYQIFVKATGDDGSEAYAGFVITLGSTENVGQPMGKTSADCRYVFRWEAGGKVRLYDNGVASGYVNNVDSGDLAINFEQASITTIGTGATTVMLDLQPGDTIGLKTDEGVIAGKISLKGVQGLPGAPIYLTNVDGPVTLYKAGTNTGFCLKPQNNNHLVIFGQGTYENPCGLSIGSGTGASSAIQYNNGNYDGIEIAYVYVNTASFAGISIKNQLDDGYYRHTHDMRYVCVHHCLVTATDGEAIYCGYGFYHNGKPLGPNSTTVYPHDIRHIHIHDNECYTNGWDAFQLKNNVSDSLVERNFSYKSSRDRRNGQNEGANLAEGFSGEFRYNVIIEGGQQCIWFGPSGNCSVHHNIFFSFNNRAIFGALRGRTDDPALSNIPGSSQYARVFNNSFLYVADPNIADVLVDLNCPLDHVDLRNNLFVVRPGGPTSINVASKVSKTIEPNVVLGSMDLAMFRDPVNWDYTPLEGSPAEGAGVDLSAYGITKDYYGNTIDWNDVDAGALQVGGTPLAYRFERLAALNLAPNTPLAPSGLSANVISDSRVDLTWTINSTDEENIVVEYKTNASSSWTVHATLEAGITGRSITGLIANTLYNFRVKATNLAGSSSYTTTNATTGTAPLVIPTAPSNLTLITKSDTSLTISWILNSTNEAEVIIERYIGGVWTEFKVVTAGTFQDTLINLTASTIYVLRIIATNSVGDSLPSNELTVTTDTEASPLGIMYAYTEAQETVTGFARTLNAIPSSIRTRETFRVIEDNTLEEFPDDAVFPGKEGDFRMSDDGTQLAVCMKNNYWVRIPLIGGSVSFANVLGSPTLNVELTTYIENQINNALAESKKFVRYIAGETISTNTTSTQTLYTKTVPANTIKVGSIIRFAPYFSWSAPDSSLAGSVVRVKLGGVTLLEFTVAAATTNDSYYREQTVYVKALTGANNNFYRIISGTSDQGGALTTEPATGTIDHTIANNITVELTLTDGTEEFIMHGMEFTILIETE